MRRLSTSVLAILLLATAIPLLSGAFSAPASASVPSFESRLLSLTNSDRARAGLAPLQSSATLVSIARSWSAHMAATGLLGHNPALASQVTGWSMLGENAAKAFSSDQAEQLFMASAGHRANILQPKYNRVGIGVVQATDGSYWFTVDFEQAAGYVQPAGRVRTASPAVHPAARWVASRSAAAGRASRSARRTAVPRTRTGAATGSPALLAAATAARLTAADARSEALQAAASLPRPVLPDDGGGLLRILLVCGALGAAALAAVLLGVRRATGG